MRKLLSGLLDEPFFMTILSNNSIELGILAGLLSSLTRFPNSNIIHEIHQRASGESARPFANVSRKALLDKLLNGKRAYSDGLTLSECISKHFPEVDQTALVHVLSARSPSELASPTERTIYSLLNSSLDARVIDFVRRDSHHLGIRGMDSELLDDLLPHLTLERRSIEEGKPAVLLKQTGISVAERIILQRYWLYQRVYWNRPNRMLASAIKWALTELNNYDTFEPSLLEIALDVDEPGFLSFCKHFATEHGRTDIRDFLELVTGDEPVLYNDVISYSEAELSRGDIDQDDRRLLRMVLEDRIGHSKLHQVSRVLSEYVSTLHPEAESRGPLVIVDLPFEPDSRKLGEDIRVAFSRSFGSDHSAFGPLDKASPVIQGVIEGFRKELTRMRVFVRPDIHPTRSLREPLHANLVKAVQYELQN